MDLKKCSRNISIICLVINLGYLLYLFYLTFFVKFFVILFSYLTNWGLIITTIYIIFKVFKFKIINLGTYLQVIANIEIIISIIFWTLLFPAQKNKPLLPNIITHLLQTLYLLSEIVLNKDYKFRKINLVYSLAINMAYGVINLLIYVIAGKVIYPIFNYKDYKTVVYIILGLVLHILIFTITYYTKVKYFTRKELPLV